MQIYSLPVIELGTVRLHRAIKRLREQDRAGALSDMKAALTHMHRSRMPPVHVQHLAEIIRSVERQG